MKKLLALLISIITAVLMLTGCNPTADILPGVDGEYKSGNGTFLVEKGDYVYFINGQESLTADNTLNTPVKSALVRVKTSDIGKLTDGDLANDSEVKVDTVVSKILMTGNYGTGVYFYGDSVYYATPSTNKDKTGAIQNQKTEFASLNLKTGKFGKAIATADDNTTSFKFVQVGENVYLTYTLSETVDGATENKFKVVNASNCEEVYTSSAYESIAFADDNSATVFFTTTAYSESLEQDESFNNLYSYKVGDADAKLVVTGAGRYALDRDYTATEFEGKEFVYNGNLISGAQGITISLIKNTGALVVFKVTTTDSNSAYQSNMYFGANIVDGGVNVASFKKLGDSNVHVDKALSTNSYYESLNAIYYIDSENYGLMKYNYENSNNAEFGTEIISSECKNYSISFVDKASGYMYLCNTAEGIYYRANYTANDVKVKQINGIAMQTSTAFYSPRVIGNYFIGSYANEPFYKYAYVVDMSKIDDETKLEGKDVTYYENYLETIVESDKETIKKVHGTLLGKMNETDSDSYEKYLEDNFA